LLYGFVDLANLFISIDDTFLSIWNGRGRKTNCSKNWLMEVQHRLDASAVSAEENLETQMLDISISRRWLQVLGWQITVKQGLLTLNSHDLPFDLKYPIELAKDVVRCISTASQSSIDSHGIGMVSTFMIQIIGYCSRCVKYTGTKARRCSKLPERCFEVRRW
jgi:hypothetical protein